MDKKKIIIISLFCTFIITIFVVSTYKFKLKGNSSIILSYGDKYKDEGFESELLSFPLNRFVKVKNNINEQKIGNYTIEYKLFFEKIKRNILVKDSVAPDLKLDGDVIVNLPMGKNYEELGFSAKDNYDGDLTDKVLVTSNIDSSKMGQYEVLYEVSDSSNNKSSKKRTVNIVDDTFPVLNLSGNIEVNVFVGEPYYEAGYSASDNIDGDITSKVVVTANVNYQKIGDYEILYEVSDSSGNKVNKKRIIHVINKKDDMTQFTYIRGILLVNKTHPIPATYNPGENREAKEALMKLQIDAKSKGYELPLLSGFRSYETQRVLYDSYVQRDGQAKADTYSARPGTSEHQTGLAFDIGKIDNNFGETPEGKWLALNAHKYGFIIRYQKGKEHITGYQYEPWHVRYLGIDIAKDVYNSGLTLEEYLNAT